jgi:hypothetical protein
MYKCKFNLPDEKNCDIVEGQSIMNMVFQTSSHQKVMVCYQEILYGIS